jgi:hypothetical protein
VAAERKNVLVKQFFVLPQFFLSVLADGGWLPAYGGTAWAVFRPVHHQHISTRALLNVLLSCTPRAAAICHQPRTRHAHAAGGFFRQPMPPLTPPGHRHRVIIATE